MTPEHNVTELDLTAPGKINLSLAVLGRRDDGFHEIESLMITVGLADRVRLAAVEGGEVTVISNDPAAPSGEANLAHRAATLLRERTGVDAGCRIELTKRIPVGGGMGGGSSNAATVLAGLNQLWRLNLSIDELSAIGAELGSDVPFFFHAPCAIVCGKGERVRSIVLQWHGWAVLAHAGGCVSTPRVYRQWSRTAQKRQPHISAQALAQAESADQLSLLMFNDLEAAVFAVAPDVEASVRKLYALSGRTFRVSGAGSVLFDLFDDADRATALADRIKAAGVSAEAIAVAAPFEMTTEEKHAWKSPM